jgi:translation initiation factor IF-3
MRLISERGEQLGVMTKPEALARAEQEGKDLVLITDKANPPVVKLIALSKHKYQQQQKSQEEKKASRAADTKELRLSPFMAQGDLDARIARTREFLTDNHKVKLQMKFKGREITKKEFGEAVFKKLFSAVADLGGVEIPPKLLGKVMFAQITPVKGKRPAGSAPTEVKSATTPVAAPPVATTAPTV